MCPSRPVSCSSSGAGKQAERGTYDLREELFFDADFFPPEDFRPELDFFADDFLAADFFAPFFGGTFAPDRRASLRAIAIACLRFLTFFRPPDFSCPCLYSCMTFPTFFCALREVLRGAIWTTSSGQHTAN